MKRFIFSALISLAFASASFAGTSVDNAFKNNIRQGDGKIVISTTNSALDVASGVVDDANSINKFGRNIEVDSGVLADVWDGGYTVGSGGVSLIWVAPTAARVHQLVSSSTSDDGDPAGVGARTVRVYYLKDWDTPELFIDIVMNGTTNVALPSLVMINRMEVLTKGATNVNVGVIKATADTDSTITSQIRVGQGQTQQVILGISSLDTMYIGRIYGNTNKAGGAAGLVDISLLVNPEPDAEEINFLTKHTFGLQTVGSSALTINYFTPKVVSGPALIKMAVLSGTNDMDISAGFDGIIKADISDFNILVTSNRARQLDRRILTTSGGRILRTTQ